jgi:hypothetical protein
MILDSEEQRNDLVSLLILVPVQGNLSQGVDRLVDRLKLYVQLIQQAKVEEKFKIGQDMK